MAFAVLDLGGSATALGQVLAARMRPDGRRAALRRACSPTGSTARWSCRSRTCTTALAQGADGRAAHHRARRAVDGPAPRGGRTARRRRVGFPAMAAMVPAARPARAAAAGQRPAQRGPAGSLPSPGPRLGTLLVVTVGSGWAVAGRRRHLAGRRRSCCCPVPAARRAEPRPRRPRHRVRELREGWPLFRGTTWLWVVVARVRRAQRDRRRGLAHPRPGAGRRDDRPPGLGVGAVGRGRGPLVATLVLLRVPVPRRSWSAWSAPRCSASRW